MTHFLLNKLTVLICSDFDYFPRSLENKGLREQLRIAGSKHVLLFIYLDEFYEIQLTFRLTTADMLLALNFHYNFDVKVCMTATSIDC